MHTSRQYLEPQGMVVPQPFLQHSCIIHAASPEAEFGIVNALCKLQALLCIVTGAHEPQVQSPSSPSYPQADQESPETSAASSLTHVAPMTPGTPTPSQTDSQSPATPRRPSVPPSQKGVELQNKAPHWNDTLRCWCLNFRGRVKLASVKNFQLIKAEDPSKAIVMQVSTLSVMQCAYIV